MAERDTLNGGQMLKRFRFKKGQALSAEIVITLLVVTLAIAAMSNYFRRTLQARTRDLVVYARAEAETALLNSDGVGPPVALQYEPYYVMAVAEKDQSQSSTSNINATGEFNLRTREVKTTLSNSTQLAPNEWF